MYSDCTNDNNACCQGLTCVADNPFYSQCRYVAEPPSSPSPTSSPTAPIPTPPTPNPTTQPTSKVSSSPTGTPEGCYSNNYKTCIPAGYDAPDTMCNKVWLPNGALIDGCLALWGECTGQGDDKCCGSAKCYGDDKYSACVPDDNAGTFFPTSSPTEPVACIECDDIPTSSMVSNSLSCLDVYHKMEVRCVKDNWMENKYCQLSCYNAGYGYEGDMCCNGGSSGRKLRGSGTKQFKI